MFVIDLTVASGSVRMATMSVSACAWRAMHTAS